MAYLSLADLEVSKQELIARVDAIVELAKAEDRELSDDEKSEIDQITDEQVPSIEEKIDTEEKIAALATKKLHQRAVAGELPGQEQPTEITVPARAKAAGRLKVYEDEKDAYVAGNIFLASIYGNQRSLQWCEDHGYSNTMTEGAGTKGGFLVPEEMQRTLVRLREERGVFPQYARSYPMASDNLFVPRDISDVTAYWVGERAEITASDDDLGSAELTAKKLACLTKVSTELDEDSVVDIGEMITRSMAYAMADKIDEAGFNGDGTSTYGGVTGLKNAIHANATVDAASGNDAPDNLDLVDFESVAGALPQYSGIRPAWFVHSAVYYASMGRLMNAAGGQAGNDIAAGTRMMFLGYPVVFSQVLHSTTTTSASTIVAYLGDLSLAATVGTRRSVRTQVSLDRYFENDLIGIKCTERIAINVHERGSTIKTRPVIALKTAS